MLKIMIENVKIGSIEVITRERSWNIEWNEWNT